MLKPPLGLFAFHWTVMLVGAGGIYAAHHTWGLPNDPAVAVLSFASAALWTGMAKAARR